MSRPLRRGLLFVFAAIILFIAWLAYPAGGVPILAYHQVNDDGGKYSISIANFSQQMEYLTQQGYTAVTVEELADFMTGKGSLPPKPIVITFDDGYNDNLSNALPVLEKYGLRATVFIITDKVGQDGYLTWDEIRQMKKRGTEIGSHTHEHLALSDLDTPGKVKQVTESKAILEQQLAAPINVLAYPYGSFDSTLFDILQTAGYKGACTGINGLNKSGGNVYALKRINVGRDRIGLAEFRLRLLRANVYSKLSL